MMYRTTWTDPVSIFSKSTRPLQHILSVFFFQSSLYFGNQSAPTKTIQAANFYSKNLGPHFNLPETTAGSCSMFCQPLVILLAWDWSLHLLYSGTKQYNEVWTVVEIFFFLVSILWYFFVSFLFVWWGCFYHEKQYSCYDIKINIRQIHTSQDFEQSKG